MEEKMFNELMENIRQGKAIMGGEMELSGKFVIDDLDVKSISNQFNLSQTKFAQLLGISIGTLRNWEQGRRKPDGPAKTLLRVAAKHPEAILDVSRSA